MSVIYFLIGVGILVAGGFLLAFIWAVKSGQYEDDYTPSVRILFDDLNKNGSADYAWTLYDDLKQKKLIEISIKDGEELYERELILYTKEIKDKSKDRVHFKMQMDDLQRIINSNHRVKIVQNKCRSILVCRVLRRYLDDFEEFKKIGDVLD